MVAGEEQSLTEDERRALRGSKFAPLPASSLPSSRQQPRFAHPGGPLTTNKAAALAKFLERKLQQPDGLNALDPNHVELAVKNAKQTVIASKVVKVPLLLVVLTFHLISLLTLMILLTLIFSFIFSYGNQDTNSEEIAEGEEKGKKRKKKKYEEVDKTEGKQKQNKKKKKRKNFPVDSTEEQKKKKKKMKKMCRDL